MFRKLDLRVDFRSESIDQKISIKKIWSKKMKITKDISKLRFKRKIPDKLPNNSKFSFLLNFLKAVLGFPSILLLGIVA